MIKSLGSEVILPVLVIELELRTLHLHECSFGRIEFGNSFDAVRAIIVRAFMDSYFLLMLPSKESQATIRTKELRLSAGSESLLHLEKKRANFAENLRAFLPVVEVEISIWRSAAGTDDMHWNR